MKLTCDTVDPSLAILVLDDDVDEHSAEELVNSIETLLEKGVRKVIVNCERLTHISSSGLGALIRMHHRLRKRNGAMRVVNLHGTPADALRVTQLDHVFDLDPDMEAARAELAAV